MGSWSLHSSKHGLFVPFASVLVPSLGITVLSQQYTQVWPPFWVLPLSQDLVSFVLFSPKDYFFSHAGVPTASEGLYLCFRYERMILIWNFTITIWNMNNETFLLCIVATASRFRSLKFSERLSTTFVSYGICLTATYCQYLQMAVSLAAGVLVYFGALQVSCSLSVWMFRFEEMDKFAWFFVCKQ